MQAARAAWRLLRRDRELLATPALASGAFAVVTAAGLLVLRRSDVPRTGEVGFWLVLVTASVLSACVIALTPVLADAQTRAGRLLRWTAFTAALSLARDRSDERLGSFGRPLVRVGGATLRGLSIVALPVIVFRDVGPAEGMRRSACLVRARGWSASTDLGPGRLGALSVLAAATVGVAVVTTCGFTAEAAVAVLIGIWTAVVLTVTSALVRTSPRSRARRRGRTR